jgi:hypothetical protein
VDVILDNNIYVSLLYNNGAALFESAEFVSLMAYLRRTGDSLVIPDVVYEEFRHEYRERVQRSFKQAQDAWDSHVRDLPGPKHFPHTLNIDTAWKAIEANFLNPDKNVNVIHYRDYSKIPAEQVVRRGVYRIPPANSNGEELRDVVLWLMTLEYARGKKVAFICSDGHFRSGDDLHPDLEKEAASYGADLKLYKTLPTFIKDNSLASAPVSNKEYQALLSDAEIRIDLTEYFIGSTLRNNTITSAVIESVDLHEGTRYEVSGESSYIELSVKGIAHLQMKTPEFVTFSEAFLNEAKKPWRYDPGVFYGETTAAYQGLAGIPPQFATYNITDATPTRSDKTLKTEAKFLADYRIRMTNNKRQSSEIDHILISETSEFTEIDSPQTQ